MFPWLDILRAGNLKIAFCSVQQETFLHFFDYSGPESLIKVNYKAPSLTLVLLSIVLLNKRDL